jgi:nucleotide-binding universal stress UspA family protein
MERPAPMLSLPLRSILVATDLGDGSDTIVASAAALTAATGAELHAFTSFDLRPLPHAERDEASTFPERVTGVRKALDDLVARAVPPDVTVASREVVIFVAHKAIRDRAAEISADLIVLGRHRARRGDAFLGSTAERVIRTARVPVLVLEDTLSLPLRSVVCAVDLSEQARIALDHAVSWISSLGAGEKDRAAATLSVLHVVPGKAGEAGEAGGVEGLDREVEHARVRAQELGATHVNVFGKVRWGEAVAEEVLGEARENDADLLVMGTRGRGALGRVLMGSVASAVAREAPCPVLLVPMGTSSREDGR